MAVPGDTAGFDSASRNREAAIEDEVRRRLARDLHDGVAQTLTTMLVQLETFRMDQVGRQSVLREVDVLKDATREVLDNLRTLLYELRGEEKIGENFVDAVRGLIERFQENTRISAQFSVAPEWPKTLRSAAAVNLYRIIEEALRNVRSHSGAGQVRVVLGPWSDSQLAILIKDDGRGLASDLASRAGTGMPGMGTLGMRERAVLLGGDLHIENVSGGGTLVKAIVPRDVSLGDVLAFKEMPA